MNLSKGTTNFAFKFKGGIVLGTDSRITDISTVNSVERLVIVTDNERKFFQLSSDSNIMCTFMGSRIHWDGMYNEIQKQAPKSVHEAYELAKMYLAEYIKTHSGYIAKYLKRYQEELGFGMLIAGCCESEGYKLCSVSLEGKDIEVIENVDIIVLGSGGWRAQQILQNMKKNMTNEEAIDLGFKALLYATFYDRSSGGDLAGILSPILMHVHKNGVHKEDSNVLDQYYEKYDFMSTEQESLFLVYSTDASEIEIADDEIIRAIWPGGGVNLNQKHGDVITAHLVAKKRDFYFHRLVFDTPQEAEAAYNLIHRKQNNYLPSTVALQNLLTKFVHSGTRTVSLFVAKSSRNLLKEICSMS
ncbi:hypothetical protein M0R45_005054 [Rubus argutus]|uniref:Uncharacterized protein n=1 Tax=Rubus argutus TaxID=59490 RepID=A0AAW1YLI6_RUBAR